MTMTVTTFRSLRSDSNYKLFWVKVTATAAQLGVHEAQFPHCRKAHKRYEQGGMDSHHFPTTVEEQINFEALDNICTCITWRFDQPGYRMYRYIQELLKTARKEEYQTELTFVTDFYGSDLNPYLLTTQAQVSSETSQLSSEKSLAIADIIKFLKKLSPVQQNFFPRSVLRLNYSS